MWYKNNAHTGVVFVTAQTFLPLEVSDWEGCHCVTCEYITGNFWFEIYLYEACIQCHYWSASHVWKLGAIRSYCQLLVKRRVTLVLWKKKVKHDFDPLALASRGHKVVLCLFCHSEGWLVAAVLRRGQPHSLTGWGWQDHSQFTVTFTLRTTGAATSLEALHS